MLQGIGAWEWKAYANKNMIFGTHQLFRWLEGQAFAPDGMHRLWDSYYNMAGRLFARMQCYPEENKGFDVIMRETIPDAASRPIFWNAFMREIQDCIETDHEARTLARFTRNFVKNNPNARLGLWGIMGRGYSFLKNAPDIHPNMVWVTDKQSRFHGIALEYTQLCITPPDTIDAARLDCLVIATRQSFIGDVVDAVSTILPQGTAIISVDGLSYIGKAP